MTNRLAGLLGQTSAETTKIMPTDPPEMRLMKKHIWTLCTMTRHERCDKITQCIGILGRHKDGMEADAIMFVHVTGPEEPGDKAKAMNQFGREARRLFTRLDAACFVSEAWHITTDNPWGEVRPAHNPKRQESVTVQCETPTGTKLTTYAEVRRREDGTIEPLKFYEPNGQTMLDADGLMAAFWEGYREEVDSEE